MGLSLSREASQDDIMLGSDTGTGAETSDANNSRSSASTSTETPIPSAPSSSTAMELKKMKKAKTNIATSSAKSTLLQRITLLKAAAKGAVSLSSNLIGGTISHTAVKANAFVEGVGADGWVEVRVKTGEVAGTTTDAEIQPGPIGISFLKSRTSRKYQAAVDSLVPDSQASRIALINAGDLLVAINGGSLKNKAFLSVIKLIIEAPRPVVLRFLTPKSTDKEAVATETITIQPLAPTLVSATRHSLCITWEKLPVSVASSAVALYQLQFAKQSGDDSNSWLTVVMKEEGTCTEEDMTGVTDQTNGTMVGLEPAESVVFRVRCRSGQRWGPYSLSSSSMRMLDVLTAGTSKSSGAITPTLVSRKDLTAAIFVPGICPEYVERGQFFYRVLQASQAHIRPDLNAKKLDIMLERGQVIKSSERRVCPGTNQIFIRLTFGSSGKLGDEDKENEGVRGELMLLRNGERGADDDVDGVWVFENTPQGDVVLERLPESGILEIGPSLREQAKSMVQSFLSSRGSPPSSGRLADNVNFNSTASISSLISIAASRSSFSSFHTPAPPRILQCIPASSSEIIVTWEPVNNVDVAKYQIQYVKGRLVAMWRTVRPDIAAETVNYLVTGLQPTKSYRFRIRSGTEDNKWSPFSDSSESCRTLPRRAISLDGGSCDEDDETSILRQPACSDTIIRPTMTSLDLTTTPQNASMRAGNSILDKAVAVASRLSMRSQFSSRLQIETQTDEAPLNNKENDEAQQHVDDRKSEMDLPESRHVNLANWKSSSRIAHEDFRFYHITKFEEQDEDSHQHVSRGHRELVVTPSLLVVLNVMVATREGFAFVEEWSFDSTNKGY